MGLKPRIRFTQAFDPDALARKLARDLTDIRRWRWVTRSSPGYNVWPGASEPYRVENGSVAQEWWQENCSSVPYVYPDRWAWITGGLKIPNHPVRVEFSARIIDGPS